MGLLFINLAPLIGHLFFNLKSSVTLKPEWHTCKKALIVFAWIRWLCIYYMITHERNHTTQILTYAPTHWQIRYNICIRCVGAEMGINSESTCDTIPALSRTLPVK